MKKLGVKNKAFNLAEILIALLIIGFISTLGSQAVRQSNNNYTKQYFTAYNTLMQAAGNAALNWNPICQCSGEAMLNTDFASLSVCWSRACWAAFERNPFTAGYEELAPRAYPGYLMGDAEVGDFDGFYTDEAFCNYLTSNIITINENAQCRYFINSYATQGLDYSQGINFYQAFCSTDYSDDKNDDTTIAEDYRTRIAVPTCSSQIQPTFETANGQKFYVSRLLSVNAPASAFQFQREREFFRLVVVDINGDSAPNSQLRRTRRAASSLGRLPDLVLFALKADGTVIPLGRPEYSRNYANAIVQYPEFTVKRNNAGDITERYDASGNLLKNEVTQSDAMTLAEAKNKAWGLMPNSGLDVTFDTAFNQIFSNSEPLSYSVLLYTAARCKLGFNCNDAIPNDSVADGIRTTFYMDELFARLVHQFVLDVEGETSTVIPTTAEINADYLERGCTTRFSRCKVEIKN